MEYYKDILARLANQMNTRIATETDSPEKNELKKKYGRIFQTNHCSLRLAERGLEIARDEVPGVKSSLTWSALTLSYSIKNPTHSFPSNQITKEIGSPLLLIQ